MFGFPLSVVSNFITSFFKNYSTGWWSPGCPKIPLQSWIGRFAFCWWLLGGVVIWNRLKYNTIVLREGEWRGEGKILNFGTTCQIFTFVQHFSYYALVAWCYQILGILLSDCITQARDRVLTSVDMDEDYEIPDSIQYLYNDARILKVMRMCDLLYIRTYKKAWYFNLMQLTPPYYFTEQSMYTVWKG